MALFMITDRQLYMKKLAFWNDYKKDYKTTNAKSSLVVFRAEGYRD